MRKWFVRISIVLFIVVLALVLRVTAFAPRPVAVTVFRAETGTVERTVSNSKAGAIRSRLHAELSAETGGIVERIKARRGDMVKQGAVLIELRAASQAASVAHASRSHDESEARRRRACFALERARQEYQRARRLVQREVETPDRVDALKNGVDLAEAECAAAAAAVERARASVAVARAELDKMTIRAPFAGVVAELRVEVGEWVTPAPPLMQVPGAIDVLDPDRLYVVAPMDEVDSTKIEIGQRVWITIDSFPNRRFSGRVSKVAPYVLDLEAQNRTVEVEVDFADASKPRAGSREEQALPGTSADIEVVLVRHDEVLRIPANALLEGDRVLVLEDGVIASRPLVLGIRNWNFAEVASGLERGDLVVTSLERTGVEAGVEATVEREVNARPKGGRP